MPLHRIRWSATTPPRTSGRSSWTSSPNRVFRNKIVVASVCPVMRRIADEFQPGSHGHRDELRRFSVKRNRSAPANDHPLPYESPEVHLLACNRDAACLSSTTLERSARLV